MSTFHGYEVFSCPCGAKAWRHCQSSGNTFGAKYWSDMYLDAPMGFDSRVIAKCSRCKEYFYIYAQEPEISDVEQGEELVLCRDFASLSKAMTQLKARGTLTEDQEVTVRLRLFWASHNHDDGVRLKDVDEKIAYDNMLALLNSSETPNYLKAEICRELGDFEKAKEYLKIITEEEGWFGAVPYLEKAIAEKRTDVFSLK